MSLLFTATTLASAVALLRIGGWIDRTDLLRYSLACGAFLAISCVAIGLARELILLVIGMLCLRLAGNGLLTHVALTATARHFLEQRGQALSLVLLGASIGEGGFPVIVTALISVAGWRWTFAGAGCFGLVLVIAAAAIVFRDSAFRHAHVRSSDAGPGRLQHVRVSGDVDQRRYFAFSAALFIAMPMVVTAMIFHQALLAQAKGVSLHWFAISFIAFAVSRVVWSVITGPIVDRIGSAWLFSLHLLPLVLGTVELIAIRSPWAVPFFWFCAGMSSGMGAVLQTTVVAERVPLARLGSARSTLAAVTIVASAIGPSLFGLGLAMSAGVRTLLWASVAALLASTVLGFIAIKSERSPRALKPSVEGR